MSWSGLLVRTSRRRGRGARPRRCCGPRTVFRTPRSLVGARPRRSLSVGGGAGSPRREPLRWGAFGRGVAAPAAPTPAVTCWRSSDGSTCTSTPTWSRGINNVADANWRVRRLGWLCVVEEDMLGITLVEADEYPAGTPTLA